MDRKSPFAISLLLLCLLAMLAACSAQRETPPPEGDEPSIDLPGEETLYLTENRLEPPAAHITFRNVLAIGEASGLTNVWAMGDDGYLWSWTPDPTLWGDPDSRELWKRELELSPVALRFSGWGPNLVLSTDGVVYYQQYTSSGDQYTPVLTPVLDRVRQLERNGSVDSYGAAVREDDTLWLFGVYAYPAPLYTQKPAQPVEPVQVLENVLCVSVSENGLFEGLLALKRDGTLWTVEAAMGPDDEPVYTPVRLMDHVTGLHPWCPLVRTEDGRTWLFQISGDGKPAAEECPVDALSCEWLYGQSGDYKAFLDREGRLWSRGHLLAKDCALFLSDAGHLTYLDSNHRLLYRNGDIAKLLDGPEGDWSGARWTEPEDLAVLDEDVVYAATGGTAIFYIKSDGTLWMAHADPAVENVPVSTAQIWDHILLPDTPPGERIVTDTWEFTPETGRLVFTGPLEGPTVDTGAYHESDFTDPAAIAPPSYGWSTLVDRVTAVELREGITDIPAAAFYGFTKLEEITLPRSLQTIGELAFYQCAFSEIALPPDMEAIGAGAFTACRRLRTCDFYDLEILENSLLQDCAGLDSISMWDGTRIIKDGLLGGCTGTINTVVFSENLTSLGDLGNERVTRWIFRGEPPELEGGGFAENLPDYVRMVNYPAGSRAWQAIVRANPDLVEWVEGLPGDGA